MTAFLFAVIAGTVTVSARAPCARAVVWVFLATTCPISNGYAPKLRRIQADYGAKGVAFDAVYPLKIGTCTV